MSVKTKRIASNIVKEISYILAYEVTVTDCKLTTDLSFAKIYVTVFEHEKKETTLKSLNDAAGFIRKQLAERINIRHIPELEFVYDESIDYGNKIDNIIEQIHKENRLIILHMILYE